MRVSHGVSAVFDDPNLVSCSGLARVLALAERCGLHRLVADAVTLSGPAAANAAVKVPALVAGMIAGADSIDDMDLLRHGGMGRLFGGIRAPSTLGSFLRTFRFGQVRQLDAVGARLLANLASHTPLLRDADQMVLVDVDDTVRATYGYAKQGAGYGYTKVKGLNALIGAVSTPISAPVIAATRLRKGATNSTRGAARLVADTLAAAKRCGATGLVVVRCDSAFYNADVVAAIRRRGARFSITARHDTAVVAAIGTIPEQAWIPITYPEAIYDDQEQRWISDAEVAETPLHRVHLPPTRPAGHRPVDRATGQTTQQCTRPRRAATGLPLPRRVHRQPAQPGPGRALPPRPRHRRASHCRPKNGPLAHLPSGSFAANSAWLVCATMAFNLTRADGCLASTFHAKATTGTIRAHLVNVPGRLARSARRLVIHLPTDWPWEHTWSELFTNAHGPPGQTTP